jgi:hypothetical protein
MEPETTIAIQLENIWGKMEVEVSSCFHGALFPCDPTRALSLSRLASPTPDTKNEGRDQEEYDDPRTGR